MVFRLIVIQIIWNPIAISIVVGWVSIAIGIFVYGQNTVTIVVVI
jgi:hypothetical protein